jgi:zinc protease
MPLAALALAALAATGCQRAIVAPLQYGPPPLAPEEAFRATPPDASPVVPAVSIPWRFTELPNGMRVAHLERHALPVVTVRLVIARGAADAGASEDAYGILRRLLDGGTREHGGAELAAAWAKLGALRGVSFGPDGCGLWAKVGAADLDAAAALIAEAATRPGITPQSFLGARFAWARDMDNSRAVSDVVMLRNTHALLFGRDHAYGQVRPTAARLDRLRVEDVTDLHARLFHPQQATLVVIGDVDAATVDAVAARRFGGWAPGTPGPLPRAVEVPPTIGEPHVVLYPRRDAETNVSVIARGPGAGHEDLYALEVLAQTLGGLSSRLRGEVREDRGAAYLFGAGVGRLRLASYVSVGGALAAPRAMPTLRAMIDAVRNARGVGPSAAEVERAKTSLVASFLTRASTTDGLAALAATTLALGLPLESLESYPAKVRAVTPADVVRVARRYFAEGALRVVVTGDPGLLRDLSALDLGEVERRDGYGEVLSR